MTEINPRIVDGEPVCNEECRFCRDTGGGIEERVAEHEHFGRPVGRGVSICIPGLRKQRDEARHLLCEEEASWSQEFNVSSDPKFYAKEHGWSYLYEKEERNENV